MSHVAASAACGAASGAAFGVTNGVVAPTTQFALSKLSGLISGASERYWKCVVENRSKYTLVALGSSSESGSLATTLVDIPPGHSGASVWAKTRGTACGACGVVHYRILETNRILNIMASVPFDWNLYGAWCNVRVCDSQVPFHDMYNGVRGCAYPTKAGNWGQVDGCKMFLTNLSEATFTVVYSGEY